MPHTDLRPRAGAAKPTHSQAALFLIEMIIAIGVFSLCCAVCVQMFALSWQYSRQSRALTQATLLCQSSAEAFRIHGGELAPVAALLEGELVGDRVIAQYDTDWLPRSGPLTDEGYRLTLTAFGEQSLRKATVVVARCAPPAQNGEAAAEQVLFELNVQTLRPREETP